MKLAERAEVTWEEYHEEDTKLVVKKLMESMRKTRESRKNAHQHRQQHLKDAAKAAMLKQKITEAKAIKAILHHEEVRREYREIRNQIKPWYDGGTNEVQIPGDEDWETIREWEEID